MSRQNTDLSDLQMNTAMSISKSGELMAGDYNVFGNPSTTNSLFQYCWPDYYPSHHTTYSYVYPTNKSSLEIAFNIVTKMMEKKIIKNVTLEKFISLVNDVKELV